MKSILFFISLLFASDQVNFKVEMREPIRELPKLITLNECKCCDFLVGDSGREFCSFHLGECPHNCEHREFLCEDCYYSKIQENWKAIETHLPGDVEYGKLRNINPYLNSYYLQHPASGIHGFLVLTTNLSLLIGGGVIGGTYIPLNTGLSVILGLVGGSVSMICNPLNYISPKER